MDKSLDEIIAGDRPARVAVKGSNSGAPGLKSSESFKQPGGGRGGGWGVGQVMYFPSGTPGHKSPNCPQIGRGGGGRGSGATFKCFNCGGVGHTSADCPTPSLKGTAAAMGGEKVCYAFRKGKCLKGDACTFAHIAAPADARGKIAMRRKRSIRVDGNDTITSLEGVDVVRISDKDITLDTGGDGSQLTLDVMNDALEPYGFTVKPHPRDESWQVSDGKTTLVRLYDGLVLKGAALVAAQPHPPVGKGLGQGGRGRGGKGFVGQYRYAPY